MLTIDEALNIIRGQSLPIATERVSLSEAGGRVLAEDVIADTDLPPFNRAQMDGYAVHAEDTTRTPARLRLVGEAAAGRGWRGKIEAGEAVRIMTGAPVPAGADSVQQLEVAREEDEGRIVIIERATVSGQFIVPRASEVCAGARAIESGTLITSQMIATLASFGYADVCVGKRPRLAVVATGAELVSVGDTPAPDQIRDSNTHSLAAYARIAGAEVVSATHVADELQTIERVIGEAAANAEVVVLSGGVSVGAYDFTKTALRNLGAEIFFERVRLRPGKPTVFARLGRTLVFGLPGNPVSSAVTFHLFARTALRLMQGTRDAAPIEERAILHSAAKRATGRTSYLPATLRTMANGICVAEVIKWGGSSDFVAFSRATALVIIPEGDGVCEANTPVGFVKLPGG